ncbi:glycosyltransferase [Halobellus sp. H-GB7]|uniref:glycosyltransferase n=1 Tax=Halobellus sp. H-GB7 TaxID=3069756 RepID=UPI0027AE3651|nr:glycosyltransferase [Halobellus sp. H-GB7]MDQ2056438.1 glycosyltransferase [Halobellus sp. H-GB7]
MKIGYFCYNLSGTGPRTRAKDVINGIAENTDIEVVVLTNEPRLVSDRAEAIEISLRNIIRAAWLTRRMFSDVDVVQVPINIYQVLFVRFFYSGPLVAGVGPGIQPTHRHRLLGRLLGIDKKITVHDKVTIWGESGYSTEPVTATINRNVFYPFDSEERKRTRHELGLNDDADVILYVGELNKEYGAEIIGEMAKLASEDDTLKFIVVGDGKLRENFEDRDDLRYEGFVDNNQLPIYYNAADITVGPRKTDVTSNVGLESIACGTPFITTADGYIKEFFEDRKTYVWAERTPEKVLNTAKSLLENDKEYKRQVERGLNTFDDMSLTLESAIDTHIKVYDELTQ